MLLLLLLLLRLDVMYQKDSNVEIDCAQSVSMSYSLKYLSQTTKASPLCQRIMICLAKYVLDDDDALYL